MTQIQKGDTVYRKIGDENIEYIVIGVFDTFKDRDAQLWLFCTDSSSFATWPSKMVNSAPYEVNEISLGDRVVSNDGVYGTVLVVMNDEAWVECENNLTHIAGDKYQRLTFKLDNLRKVDK